MSELTFAQIRQFNIARDKEVFGEFGTWSIADWAVAFGGEVGETLNKIKKLRKAQGKHVMYSPESVTVDDIADELADVIVYMDILAYQLGIDLEVAYRKKFNKVSEAIGSTVKFEEIE
jgi:NTP pyrophosphatase (non-canonical NTP hydrolase)